MLIKSYIDIVLLEILRKFDLNKFKSLLKIEDRIDYANQNLPFLGEGAARIVYGLSGNKVLKIARDTEEGNAQNQAEVNIYLNAVSLNSEKAFAKIYEFDKENFSWVISEPVKEFSTRTQFDTEYGHSFYLLTDLLKVYKKYKFNIKKAIIETIRDRRLRGVINSEDKNEIISIINTDLFKSLSNAVKHMNLSIGDLIDFRHYGKTIDGKIVILDYGLTKDVYEKHYINEVLRKFDFMYFQKLNNINDMISYCQTTLPLLGEGSSRIVFGLGSNKVLKIARNEKGFAQNAMEYQVYSNYSTRNAITKIFKTGNINGKILWLASEIARPITAPSEFENITGIDWETYVEVIKIYSNSANKQDVNSISGAISSDIQKKQKEAEQKNNKEDIKYYQFKSEQIKKIFSSPFIKSILFGMDKSKLLYGDLSRIEHYGKTADGRVVLIDYGFSEDVYKTHYVPSQTAATVVPGSTQTKSHNIENIPTTAPAKRRIA